jgi:SAM-dependent methyltransferase
VVISDVTSNQTTQGLATERYAHFDQLDIDRSTFPPGALDLNGRTRTSLLPWRGQFSPGLVDVLLGRYGIDGCRVLDPFAGSGTTLIECARRGIWGLGLDINPSAVYRARTAELTCLPYDQRWTLLDRVGKQLSNAVEQYCEPTLFDHHRHHQDGNVPQNVLLTLVGDLASRDEQTVLFNIVMQAFGESGVSTTGDALIEARHHYVSLASELPVASRDLRCEQGDARYLPLAAESIDLVLTSPPYVNVFNYHQYYRKAVELVGHDLLSVARSEIGSNRKHRANRFLTVIQYCLDMQLALGEIRRVLRASGVAIVVVGRESNVLGQRFENGRAIYALALGCGFALDRRLERVFVSRYGPRVYEDILILRPATRPRLDQDDARGVAACMLHGARSRSLPPAVLASIDSALASMAIVRPSAKLVDVRVC